MLKPVCILYWPPLSARRTSEQSLSLSQSLDVLPLHVHVMFAAVRCVRVRACVFLSRTFVAQPLREQIKGATFPGSHDPHFCKLVIDRSKHLLRPVHTKLIIFMTQLTSATIACDLCLFWCMFYVSCTIQYSVCLALNHLVNCNPFIFHVVWFEMWTI